MSGGNQWDMPCATITTLHRLADEERGELIDLDMRLRRARRVGVETEREVGVPLQHLVSLLRYLQKRENRNRTMNGFVMWSKQVLCA